MNVSAFFQEKRFLFSAVVQAEAEAKNLVPNAQVGGVYPLLIEYTLQEKKVF
jgi:hypothetical protein